MLAIKIENKCVCSNTKYYNHVMIQWAYKNITPLMIFIKPVPINVKFNGIMKFGILRFFGVSDYEFVS